ncbi:hypothetical protein ml_504 [Mollivirus sibericum]|uniref:hypothetical protein n=1 Tax=Mollivirus sibericum TaxID=1678078 RepID=UPI0006B2DE4C|nr:hypothetical protein ml_504 [Mollivirus sibericum]ALD62306.1 hypothetical protein ml_504 [Mollivirus sibericum]
MDPQLAAIGKGLECLLRTDVAFVILSEDDLNTYDQGGCAVLAAALVPYLRERGYTTAAAYGIANVVDGVPSTSIGHYFVGLSLDGPFLDSNGWHTSHELANWFRQDWIRQQQGQFHWSLREQVLSDLERRFGARIVRSAPRLDHTTEGGVQCPRRSVARLRAFLEQHLPFAFLVTVDEDMMSTRLWTWTDPKIRRPVQVFVDGMPVGPPDSLTHGQTDDPYAHNALPCILGFIHQNPHIQACVECDQRE